MFPAKSSSKEFDVVAAGGGRKKMSRDALTNDSDAHTHPHIARYGCPCKATRKHPPHRVFPPVIPP